MTTSKAVNIATERENRKRKTMKNMPMPASIRQNRPNSGIARLLTIFTLLLMSASSSWAETITIGKGSGIIWEGMPFNATLTGHFGGTTLLVTAGIISISNKSVSCMDEGLITGHQIAGYDALPLRDAANNKIGIGLIPRAVGTATYRILDGRTIETLTGTIGMPETRGRTNTGFEITNPILFSPPKHWCLPSRTAPISTTYFYDDSFSRTVNISGTWVMVADGSQRSGEFTIPTMYAGSFTASAAGWDRSTVILNGPITLRISTLACTVATTTNINFGGVQRNTQVGSELARLSYPLTVACSQDTDKINANINVQFRAASGQYESTPTRLALTQGGGYVTGEIDNGVTGSGACNLTTGIPFDNTQLKVGSITSSEATKVTNNQVTWRLCSGGAALPVGPVDASTDMLVTFN
ncbi:MAG: hypothetical protein WAU54_06960 [Chania sp.]